MLDTLDWAPAWHMSHHMFDDTDREHVTVAYTSLAATVIHVCIPRRPIFWVTAHPNKNPPSQNNATVTTTSLDDPSYGLWAAIGGSLGSLEDIDLAATGGVKGRTREEMEKSAKSDPFSKINGISPSPDGRYFILPCLFHWYLADADHRIVKGINKGVMVSIRDADVRFNVFSAHRSIFFSII